MADAIGSLYVSLGLDSAAFTAGIKQAQTQAKAFANNLGKVLGGAIAAAAPAMAAIGVAAANMGAEIQRAAQLSNSSAIEFQGWAAGAKSVGIEQDKLADILKDVNDRVGDFISTGGGPMKDFFDVIGPKVGVTAEQFRNLSGPQALQLYVDSLQKANVNQQDFTFYMEAMASDGTALLPLLKNGGKGMAEYAAKAASLGLILDKKTIAAFARAKQSFSDVMSVFAGFRNIIAEQVVPPMAAMADAFVNASRQGSLIGDTVRAIAEQIPRMTAYVTAFLAVIGAKWVTAFAAARVATFTLSGALAALRGAMIATGIGAIAVLVGELAYRFTNLVTATGSVGNAFALLGEVASGVWQGIVTGAGAIPAALNAKWQLIKVDFYSLMESLSAKWRDFLNILADGADNIPRMSGVSSYLRDSAAAADEAVTGFIEASTDAYVEAERSWSKAVGAISTGLDQAKDALGKLSVAATDANATLAGGGTLGGAGGGLDQVSSASDKAKAKLSSLQEVMNRLKERNAELKATMNMSDVDAEVWRNQRDANVSSDSSRGKRIAEITKENAAMQSLKDATKEWQQSISSAFSSFLTGASSFKDMIAQIIGKLGEMALNAAFQSMFSSSSGWMGSILSGLGIGANANGTNNWRGGLTAINERGGEIVDLPSGTRIIPHDVSKRMMDGSGEAYGVQLGASSMTLTDDGRIMAQVDAKVVRMGAQIDKALPARVQQINANPRRR